MKRWGKILTENEDAIYIEVDETEPETNWGILKDII